MDLVVLGNLLVDDVVLESGQTRMGLPGGATLYATLAARLWGLRVGVASLRGSLSENHEETSPDYTPIAIGSPVPAAIQDTSARRPPVFSSR